MADREKEREKERLRRARIKAGLYPDYFCRVCKKVPTRRRFGRCYPCSMAEQRANLDAARAAKKRDKKPVKTALDDAAHLQRKMRERMAEGTPVVSDWKAPYICHGCKKPILMAGGCYSCSTGKKRLIMRPEELVA